MNFFYWQELVYRTRSLEEEALILKKQVADAALRVCKLLKIPLMVDAY
jgi:hypothetical protein